MEMLIVILVVIVVLVALVSLAHQEELVPVPWAQVVIQKGYCWMPRESLHGYSMTMSQEIAMTKQWYRRETDYGPVFYALHEDGSKWEIRAFVENQQMLDQEGWYLTTFYILEKQGYYYL